MTNEDKQKVIRPWIDPEEQITVHFLDASDLNATVTKCIDHLVEIAMKTHVPYTNQYISATTTIEAGDQ